MTCTGDTDGDGDCGRRMCPQCGPDARAAAVAAERAANEQTEPEPPAVVPAAGERPTVKVAISAFSRSVEVEAGDDLATVEAVALRLWRQTEDRGPIPVGASGFFLGEPSGPSPLAVRGLEPLDRGEQRAA